MIKELMSRADQRGYLTFDDVLEELDKEDEGNIVDSIEAVLRELDELGIQIRDPATDSKPAVHIADITPELIRVLELDPRQIYELTPDAFELLICNRMEAMGYGIIKVTENTNAPDGGIDILAWMPKFAFGGVIGIQVKHHRTESKKTGAKDVRELIGVVNDNISLQSGLLVTNTTFTKDAIWSATKSRKIMALRDWTDLIRWVRNDFSKEEVFRDLPDNIEIGNGIVIPKLRFKPTWVSQQGSGEQT